MVLVRLQVDEFARVSVYDRTADEVAVHLRLIRVGRRRGGSRQRSLRLRARGRGFHANDCLDSGLECALDEVSLLQQLEPRLAVAEVEEDATDAANKDRLFQPLQQLNKQIVMPITSISSKASPRASNPSRSM